MSGTRSWTDDGGATARKTPLRRGSDGGRKSQIQPYPDSVIGTHRIVAVRCQSFLTGQGGYKWVYQNASFLTRGAYPRVCYMQRYDITQLIGQQMDSLQQKMPPCGNVIGSDQMSTLFRRVASSHPFLSFLIFPLPTPLSELDTCYIISTPPSRLVDQLPC